MTNEQKKNIVEAVDKISTALMLIVKNIPMMKATNDPELENVTHFANQLTFIGGDMHRYITTVKTDE